MKKTIALFLVLGSCSVFATLAVKWGYYVKRQPPISMPTAYATATQLLGVATNYFYCVEADLILGSRLEGQTEDGEWDFTFYNTNGVPKSIAVFVGKDKKPQAIEYTIRDN
jgi:lipid-binding SYLF domain-containing protein